MASNPLTKEAIEAASITISNKVTYLGGGTAAVMGFLHANLVAVCGIALGILGFLTNFYFQKRRDAREQRLADRQLEKWQTKPSPLQETP